uniref:HSF-type DNA-binding domain-containing protein n=1 Tax=Attheya septentrionalis TaxID=420275 RepID=A0A7S2UK10_9STRA|mmetsp:Transcript_26221/g.47581  ORF Transcript_26221/g.47581 Transcript_26221/m.47581 type:complete len:505 (+) Transcript_26221:155-1669(+)
MKAAASSLEINNETDPATKNIRKEKETDSRGSVLTAASALTTLAHSDDSDDDSKVDFSSPGPQDKVPVHGEHSTLDSSTDEQPTKCKGGGRKKAIPFPKKLMDVLASEEYSTIISWLSHGKSFNIHKPKPFANEVLPQHFKQAKFSSFVRKLHRWGFLRHLRGEESGAFYHENFRRDKPELCQKMTCHVATPPPQSTASEVGNPNASHVLGLNHQVNPLSQHQLGDYVLSKKRGLDGAIDLPDSKRRPSAGNDLFRRFGASPLGAFSRSDDYNQMSARNLVNLPLDLYQQLGVGNCLARQQNNPSIHQINSILFEAKRGMQGRHMIPPGVLSSNMCVPPPYAHHSSLLSSTMQQTTSKADLEQEILRRLEYRAATAASSRQALAVFEKREQQLQQTDRVIQALQRVSTQQMLEQLGSDTKPPQANMFSQTQRVPNISANNFTSLHPEAARHEDGSCNTQANVAANANTVNMRRQRQELNTAKRRGGSLTNSSPSALSSHLARSA